MSRGSRITVRLLQKNEWDRVLELSTASAQKDFIESSLKCLNDARTNAYDMIWNFYGVFVDETLIGFAMHGRQNFKFIPYSRVWLDRFMIDKRFQGKGYGKTAMRLIVEKLFQEYSCNKIFLSVIETNFVAIQMYEKIGFKKTRFKDPNGERVMKCKKTV